MKKVTQVSDFMTAYLRATQGNADQCLSFFGFQYLRGRYLLGLALTIGTQTLKSGRHACVHGGNLNSQLFGDVGDSTGLGPCGHCDR